MEYQINLCLLGDQGVGKTSFVTRLATGDFKHDTDYHTFKYGNVRFNIVDLNDADCVILMFDVTNQNSYNNLNIDDITVPVLLVGNKIDHRNRVVLPSQIQFHRQHNLKYFELSARSNYNIDKPLSWAVQTLNCYLENIDDLADLIPPEIIVN
jgi:GTP-binding nuclear protein Ran